MPQLYPKRRSLAEEIAARANGATGDFVDPQDSPISQALPVNLPDDAMPLRRLPIQPDLSTGMPRVIPRSEELQGEYNQRFDTPPTGRQTLLRAVTQAAPIALGGLFGGDVGAYGASQGVEQQNEVNRQARENQRKSLLEQIKQAQDIEERQKERQMMTDVQRAGVEERAKAAEEAGKSREQVANIRAEAMRDIGDLRNVVSQQGLDIKQQQLGINQQLANIKEKTAGQGKPATIKYDQGIPTHIIGRNGDEYAIGDPGMPPELKPLEQVAINAHQQRLKEQQGLAMLQRPGTVDARADRSYQFHSNALDKVSQPITETISRMGRLQDTIKQSTPQADALVAPELLTVMSGGQGSGLRMNEAEIARIVGGRSKWESLKAAAQQWSLHPETANSITPDQRQQVRALVDAVNQKLVAKQQALEDARQQLISTENPLEHRKIYAQAKQTLADIDEGKGGSSGTGKFSVTAPDGSVHRFETPQQADAFKKLAGIK